MLHQLAPLFGNRKRSLWLSGMISLFAPFSLMAESAAERAASDSFRFINYDHNTEILEAYLVKPSIKGELLIKNDRHYQLLPESKLDNLFSLRVKIACHLLSTPSVLLWIPQHGKTLPMSIPRQHCVKIDVAKVIKTFQDKMLGCIIEIADNKLWRTATFISQYNSGTIHQNMHAIFFINKDKFIEQNIHRMKETTLRCPSPRLVASIDDSQVKRHLKMH
ncbi:hypothetical protein [Aeromonas rivipollensis]|uniref:Uncharacterized protein n=1 Tax=Aeromonas rivipollensis TaxID=948519 RepID=A0AAW9Y5W0_9GAMM|nr:hypothetical protein [Aeromonas rivipollensis]NEX73595.1 hypothetical protein [Aeromonas rivipollensis]